MLESMDDLTHSKIYKQSLKQQGNRFISMLESHVASKYDHVYSVDKEAATNVMNKVASLINELSTENITELVMIEALIQDYKLNKDEYNQKLKTNFNKIL